VRGFVDQTADYLGSIDILINNAGVCSASSPMIRSFFGSSVTQEDIDKWMQPEDIARVMIEILQEGPTGRNAQSINFCMGRPVQLEAPHEQLSEAWIQRTWQTLFLKQSVMMTSGYSRTPTGRKF
jgi:NAD(P)-dependent dehydrogenase (short-subunit alcohol dehydrogenase family)